MAKPSLTYKIMELEFDLVVANNKLEETRMFGVGLTMVWVTLWMITLSLRWLQPLEFGVFLIVLWYWMFPVDRANTKAKELRAALTALKSFDHRTVKKGSK